MSRRSGGRRKPAARLAGWGAVAAALLYALLQAGLGDQFSSPGLSGGTEPSASSGGDLLSQLHAERQSGVVVEGSGRVIKVLRDDLDGSRHQKFLLAVAGADGLTVLVSHNIDLAPRVADLARGDDIAFRGQYEWNDKGGVVHWTHSDPGGRRAGGWLRHAGVTYR